MVSRENAVITISIIVALAVGAALYEYTDVPPWVAMAAFIGLGIVVPTALNEYLSRTQEST